MVECEHMRIKSLHPHTRPFHLLVKPKLMRQFEEDGKFQARIHLVMTYYWMLNFPVIGYLYFFQPKKWITLGLLINTFYSLYANASTDYGALSAALAADRAAKNHEDVSEQPRSADTAHGHPEVHAEG